MMEGQYLVLSQPGNNPPEHNTSVYQEKRPPGYVALIRAVVR